MGKKRGGPHYAGSFLECLFSNSAFFVCTSRWKIFTGITATQKMRISFVRHLSIFIMLSNCQPQTQTATCNRHSFRHRTMMMMMMILPTTSASYLLWTSLLLYTQWRPLATVASFSTTPHHIVDPRGVPRLPYHHHMMHNDPDLTTTTCATTSTRRSFIRNTGWVTTVAVVAGVSSSSLLPRSAVAEVEPPKFIQEYPDFTTSSEGWSYKVVTPGKTGDAAAAAVGDRVVFEWSGYTIGYYGRPFQAKGGPQGGAFDKELDYERTVIGSGKMVKGLECALVGTTPGEILQIVVPYDERKLSYPDDDLDHVRVGPKPSTFSGQRALNFVLQNPRVDRTLLFNVKVVRIDKPNKSGGFSRG